MWYLSMMMHLMPRGKMGVVQDLITGGDCITLRTATGLTNRLVTRLYPLELNVTTHTETEARQAEDIATTETLTSTESSISARPQQLSAHRATVKIKEWARALATPPEDVKSVSNQLSITELHMCENCIFFLPVIYPWCGMPAFLDSTTHYHVS